MKLLIVLSFIVIIFGFSAQAQKNELIQNGYNKFYFPSGKLASEGNLRDGLPDGYWKSYHPNGIMKTEGNRKNFKLDSTWIFYNEKGDTTEKINYLAGIKNGYYYSYKMATDSSKKIVLASKELFIEDVKQGESYYYENGKLQQIISFKNGKRHGLGRELDKQGNIISLLSFHNNYLINKERINRLDNNGNKQGKWKDFFPNFNLKMESDYVNGQLDGYVRTFDVRGNLVKAERFVKGELYIEKKQKEVKVAVQNTYFPSGKVKKRGGYIDNKPVGLHVNYSEDGAILSSELYSDSGFVEAKGKIDENGKKQANWDLFFLTGKVKAKGNYADDKRNGEWLFYFESGKLEQKGTYQNGKIQGTWTWYYESGAILRTEEYNRGKEDGLMTEFAEDGKELTKGKYSDGEKEGMWTYFVGDNREEGKYKSGLKSGTWKQYYVDGVLKFQGDFVEGEPNGKHTFYNEKGKVIEEGTYRIGKKVKQWRTYSDEGTLELTITYENDQEVKIDGKEILDAKYRKKQTVQ